jgi:putative ABC transport system permease protein
VTQQVLKRFNIAGQNPAKAINEMVKMDGKDLRIIGVMKDFVYGKANNHTTQEVIMRYSTTPNGFLNVKILSQDWPKTYEKIETIWKNLDNVHPLTARFYDEDIEEGFRGFKASVKLGGFLAFLIICIASMGLLGMVVFSTETRLKEISIRKVHGASETQLVFLLSKGFLILILIAATGGLSITYVVFERMLLPRVINHAPMGVAELVIGVFAVMAIALLMIGSQTLKVARTNPGQVLKTE